MPTQITQYHTHLYPCPCLKLNAERERESNGRTYVPQVIQVKAEGGGTSTRLIQPHVIRQVKNPSDAASRPVVSHQQSAHALFTSDCKCFPWHTGTIVNLLTTLMCVLLDVEIVISAAGGHTAASAVVAPHRSHAQGRPAHCHTARLHVTRRSVVAVEQPTKAPPRVLRPGARVIAATTG